MMVRCNKCDSLYESKQFDSCPFCERRREENMGCDCEDNSTKPGVCIKQTIEEYQHDIKKMLNTLMEDMGIFIDEVYLEKDSLGRITLCDIVWDVEKGE